MLTRLSIKKDAVNQLRKYNIHVNLHAHNAKSLNKLKLVQGYEISISQQFK